MRIKEEFKKSGYFWLPSLPDRKIPGTLRISDGGNIELEVIELFNPDPLQAMHNNNDNLERIVGIIEEYGSVTLDDCFYKQKNSSLGGVSKKSLIHVNKAFTRVEYKEKENISFNTFRFSIEGIDEWVGIREVEFRKKGDLENIEIIYSRPKEIIINLNNGMQLIIKFYSLLSTPSSTTEFKITQKTYFELVSTEERALDVFIDIAHKITTLLCFAIDKIVCLEYIVATSNNISRDTGDGNLTPVPIGIYYPSLPYLGDASKIEWHRMLFRYGQIKNNAEKIINNWIDAYDQIDPALSLYFSTKMGAQKYLDGKFLALVQGLETYHRRTSTEKLMDEQKFKELVEEIISKCPEDNKEWLKGRLNHGNEIPLRKRINSIIEPFKNLVGTEKERNKIISRIVDTRNYLTHYDQSLKSKAANNEELLSLCYKMEAFFQLHFLQVLGFTSEEIKSILECYPKLEQKLEKI